MGIPINLRQPWFATVTGWGVDPTYGSPSLAHQFYDPVVSGIMNGSGARSMGCALKRIILSYRLVDKNIGMVWDGCVK